MQESHAFQQIKTTDFQYLFGPMEYRPYINYLAQNIIPIESQFDFKELFNVANVYVILNKDCIYMCNSKTSKYKAFITPVGVLWDIVTSNAEVQPLRRNLVYIDDLQNINIYKDMHKYEHIHQEPIIQVDTAQKMIQVKLFLPNKDNVPSYNINLGKFSLKLTCQSDRGAPYDKTYAQYQQELYNSTNLNTFIDQALLYGVREEQAIDHCIDVLSSKIMPSVCIKRSK